MTENKLFSVYGFLMAATLALLAGCGSGNNDAATPVAAPATAASCPAGQLYTQYGCAAVGSCQAGYATYNNQCIPGTATATTTGANTCTVGQIYTTQYGCLAQGICQYGYGDYNNTCVQGTISTGGVAAGGIGSCTVGQVYTIQYGCLAQGVCQWGFGTYNNTCVQGTVSTGVGPNPIGNPGVVGSVGACPAGQIYTQAGCYPYPQGGGVGVGVSVGFGTTGGQQPICYMGGYYNPADGLCHF